MPDAKRAPRAGYRGLILLGALAAAWLVLATGIARYQAGARPSLALAAWPGDAVALATLASSRISADATPASLLQAQGEALGALHRDLTLANAYAVLGSVADLRGRRDQARADMLASDALSRRVLIARLWLIQDAVVQGKVGGALRDFDIALRTSEGAQSLLFPALGRALGDDRLVPAITSLLQSGPPWAASFLYTTIANGQASENLARAVERLSPTPDYAGVDLRQLLIARLVDEQRFAVARRLALPGLPLGGRSLVVDPAFTDPRGDPPFNWAFTDDALLRAERTGDRPGLHVSAGNGGGGVAASQLLMLVPGAYALSGTRAGDPVRSATAPGWTIRCRETEHPLATLEMATPRPADAAFTVPAGCPFQWLQLTLQAEDEPEGQEMTFDRVQVRQATPVTPL